MPDDYLAGLRFALDQIGGTQTEMARRLGVSLYTVGRWRAGVSTPSDKNLARIARLSGIDQEDIRCGGRQPVEDSA